MSFPNSQVLTVTGIQLSLDSEEFGVRLDGGDCKPNPLALQAFMKADGELFYFYLFYYYYD